MKRKNNEELKRNSNEIKLTKKNYLVITIPIILVLMMVAAIAFYTFIYSSDEAKLKRYLINHNYICNIDTCSITSDDETETIDYRKGNLTVTNIDYSYMITRNYISYQDNKKELVCTYRGPRYKIYEYVDSTFTNDASCDIYIKQINEKIEKYQKIIDSSDIDVNQLKN